MKITSLIFFNTYGPSEGRDAVIPKFIHALNHNRPIYLEGDGKQARDFTFVDDTIFALYKIIKSKKNLRYINIGSGKSISINTIIKKLKKYYPDMRVIRNKQRINEIKILFQIQACFKKISKLKIKLVLKKDYIKQLKILNYNVIENIYILIFSFLSSIVTLKYLISNFIDKISVQRKTQDKARIRWGSSNKSHYGGFSFSLSIIIINLFLIIFFKDLYLNNLNNLFYLTIIILLSGFFGLIDEKYSCKPIEKIILQIIISVLLILNGKILYFSSNEILNYSFSVIYFLFYF